MLPRLQDILVVEDTQLRRRHHDDRLSVHKHVHGGVDMSVDMSADTCADMCTDMCADMCADMCVTRRHHDDRLSALACTHACASVDGGTQPLAAPANNDDVG